MENVTTLEPTAEELTQQIADLKNADQTKAQQLKMQMEQLQTRHQQSVATAAGTRGQIAMLEENLKEQERNTNRLEGALDILQALAG